MSSPQKPPRSPRRHVPAPAHLSEFMQYVEGNSTAHKGQPSPADGFPAQIAQEEQQPEERDDGTRHDGTKHGSTSPAHSSAAVPQIATTEATSSKSVTSSALNYTLSHSGSYQSSTAPSALDLETLITDNDVRETVETYDRLIETSREYRYALNQLCLAASDFGLALEATARLKGSGAASDGLMSCSGMQYLLANKQQFLSERLEHDFEEPVVKATEKFQQAREQAEINFREVSREKVRSLKKSEKMNRKLSKKKYRNITAYRSNLQQLTSQLDDIDRLKHDYYVESFDQVQDASTAVLRSATEIVSLETAIYESVAQKGQTGGGLESLLTDQSAASGLLDFDETLQEDPAAAASAAPAAAPTAKTSSASIDSADVTETADVANDTLTKVDDKTEDGRADDTDKLTHDVAALQMSSPVKAPSDASEAGSTEAGSTEAGSTEASFKKASSSPSTAIDSPDDTYYTPTVVRPNASSGSAAAEPYEPEHEPETEAETDDTPTDTKNVLAGLDSPEKVRTHDDTDPFSLPPTGVRS